MRSACTDLRQATHGPSSLGLVPTMGALHEGHRSLVRASKQRCSISAVSIFVNPTQFGPSEDLARYPRTFDEDCRILEAENVDLLFAPDAKEIYPTGDLRPMSKSRESAIGSMADPAPATFVASPPLSLNSSVS